MDMDMGSEPGYADGRGRRGPTTVPPAPFRAAVSRRRFLQAGGVLAGAAAIGCGASPLPGAAGRTRAAATAAATGTIADLKHVVILMQENRSFDHYYGTLQGVRGLADKQVLKYQNGTTILRAARQVAHRPRLPAPLSPGLRQGGRAERRRSRPFLVR